MEFLAPTLDTVALPAIALQPAIESRAGVYSKFGGNPDLPRNFQWPTFLPSDGDNLTGNKLDYLLQIRLDEIDVPAAGLALPSSGLLTFFYDLEEQPWGFDPADLASSKVIYTPSIEDLVSYEVQETDYTPYERAIQFTLIDTYPGGNSAELEEIEALRMLDDDSQERYTEFRERSVEAANCSMRLLGYPGIIQNDMHLEAQLVTNGVDFGGASSDARAEELKPGAKDWILLLQLSSNEDPGMMWGDEGNIYYWIRRQDLADQRFDRTWLRLQCY